MDQLNCASGSSSQNPSNVVGKLNVLCAEGSEILRQNMEWTVAEASQPLFVTNIPKGNIFWWT